MKFGEFRPLLKLAIPVVLANLSFMLMGVVDILVIGQIGAIELAGVSAGNAIFWFLLIVPSGLSLSLDPLVSGYRGKGLNPSPLLTQSLYQGAILTLLITPILVFWPGPIFELIGTSEEIRPGAEIYLRVMGYSFPFSMMGMVLQRYWNAMERPKIIAFLALAANIINLILDLTFVLGWFSAPQLGVLGVAIASFLSRLFVFIGMLAFTLRAFKKNNDSFSLSWNSGLNTQMLRIGLPAMAQWGLEMFAFTLSTLLATRINAQALSAHQVALTLASMVFMVPLGLGTAASVRVGYFLGAEDRVKAREAGWQTVILGLGFNVMTAVLFFAFAEPLMKLFIQDPNVVSIGASVLLLCGFFQIFDGSQVILAGALRGYQKTLWPLFTNFIGYYPLGLPLGAYLCFYTDWGVLGLWIGLTVGLMTASILNLLGWMRININP